ncbi:MAG: hypothetical protein GYB66_12785 [Chloroflexi bacterium]|nr:hypothetical protein [Chloroflexota bacterium]
MLPRVTQVHKPESIEEATHLLIEQDVRPLYGGVALHRESPMDVSAVVDLSLLGLEQHRIFDTGFSLGSMMTLEAAYQASLAIAEHSPNAGFLASVIRQEAPVNMRNTMTIGDVLVERRADSCLLTAFVLLDAQVDANGWPRFIHEWLDAPDVEVRSALITEVALERGSTSAKYAFEKVARTPADAPIVGAMSYLDRSADGTIVDARLAMCGIAPHPIPLPAVDEALMQSGADVEAALAKLDITPPSDHWGSSEYRLAMARVLGRRVLNRTL